MNFTKSLRQFQQFLLNLNQPFQNKWMLCHNNYLLMIMIVSAKKTANNKHISSRIFLMILIIVLDQHWTERIIWMISLTILIINKFKSIINNQIGNYLALVGIYMDQDKNFHF